MDLQQIMKHIDIYSKASNTKANKDKTHAISLSGCATSIPRNHLAALGICSWFDTYSPKALVYLGYPLYHTLIQRDTFLEQLLSKINSCNIHAQRSLSIRGRATIVNILILSTLWRVLRVCPVPKSFFRNLRSICHNVSTRRMWPTIVCHRMFATRNKDGLAILHTPAQ